MKDLFTGQLNHSAGVALPALNPFASFMHDAHTAIERLVELQHPESVRGRGAGLSVFAGPTG